MKIGFWKYFWRSADRFVWFIVGFELFILVGHLISPFDKRNILIAQSCLGFVFTILIFGVWREYVRYKKRGRI